MPPVPCICPCAAGSGAVTARTPSRRRVTLRASAVRANRRRKGCPKEAMHQRRKKNGRERDLPGVTGSEELHYPEKK